IVVRRLRNSDTIRICLRYYGHQDIHSFRTRRSSDLSASALRSANDRIAEIERQHGTEIRIETYPAIPDEKMPEFRKYEENRRNEDRKSTRLNSNHVKISYAGFCLKKKDKDSKLQRVK